MDMKQVKSVFESLDISFHYKKQDEGEYYSLAEFWTDTAGQDIPIEIDFNGTAEDYVKIFVEYANNYSVDEEVQVYIGSLGKKGVPSTAKELLADCEEAKVTLMKAAKMLQKEMNTTISVTVTAYPYATQYGKIEIPEGVEDIRSYVSEHWDEIKFNEPDLDYAGADFEVEEE